MPTRAVERSLAKHLGMARKAIIDAGANKSQVSIMSDVVVCKMNARFSDLEKMCFSFINNDPTVALKFYESIYDDVYKHFQPVINMYHPDLQIIRIEHRVEHELGYSLSIIYLNKDLENLITTGQVTIP